MAELKSIDDLKPDPGNPRDIEEPAALGLRVSLRSFGDIGGLTWNRQTGELVAGHQRVEQLRRAGARLEPGDPPHVVLGDMRWPVRVVDWSRERQRTANLAANNPKTAGDFTLEVGDILSELEGSIDEDMFAGLRLGDIEFPELKHVEFDAQVGDDEVPEPPEDPVTKPGDVWKLGNHTLRCDDSIADQAVRESCDIVLLDPPYDIRPEEQAAMVNACAGRVPTFLFSRGYFAAMVLRHVERKCWHEFSWSTRTIATGLDPNLPVIMHQQIWVFADEPRKTIWSAGKHIDTEWKKPRDFFELAYGGKDYVEKYAKPPQLFAMLFDLFEGTDRVLDPFVGAGTSIIVAEQVGKVCSGWEINPAMCDVAVERWEHISGGKARRTP